MATDEQIVVKLVNPPLLQKLASVVAEIDSVEKRGRNDFQKYNYVKAADVAWAVRKALSERNIFLVCDVIDVRNYEIPAKEGVMQAVDVKMQFSFFDGDDPQAHPIVLHSYGTGTDKGDKAIYKAQTGALKYGLRHAFLIPDESDPEADTTVDKATAAKNVAKQKLAEHKTQQEAAVKVDCLFYVYPESHNGHSIEFINVPAYIAANPGQQEGLNAAFRAHRAKKTRDETALVPSGELQGLLEKLTGDLGLTVKQLQPPVGDLQRK